MLAVPPNKLGPVLELNGNPAGLAVLLSKTGPGLPVAKPVIEAFPPKILPVGEAAFPPKIEFVFRPYIGGLVGAAGGMLPNTEVFGVLTNGVDAGLITGFLKMLDGEDAVVVLGN